MDPTTPKPVLHSLAHQANIGKIVKRFGKTAIRKKNKVHQENDDTFFEKFASVRKSYEQSKRRTLEHYRLSRKISIDPVAPHLWPKLADRTVKDLYKQVLVDLVHSFKTKEKLEMIGWALIVHLQNAFNIDPAKHKELLFEALKKSNEARVLNLEIIEAKGLKGKDANGLSDPFCTLYISSDQKHNTSVRSATLLPVWKEYFTIPIRNFESDVLHLEVWDYDNPEETISERFKKISDITSARGLRSFIKDIALPQVHGTESPNDLHGITQIPLKTIPTQNFNAWFPLRENEKLDSEITGQIRLRMTIGLEKDRKVAAEEYRHLLYLFLVYELGHHPELRYKWDGKFLKPESDSILSRLENQGGFLPCDIDLAKWLVYTKVQSKYPLDTRIYAPIFLSVVEHIRNGLLDESEVKSFWSASMLLVESFAQFIQNIHEIILHNVQESNEFHQIVQTLAVFINMLKNGVKTSAKIDQEFTVKFIIQTISKAISTGAENLYESICNEKKTEELGDMKNLISIGQILVGDLQNGLPLLQRHFKSLLDIDYFGITYSTYDIKYKELTEPIVMKICKNLKPLELHNTKNEEICQEEDIANKTTLFELYLTLKQFADLSSAIIEKDGLKINGHYHTWFYAGVTHWLDIAWYRAEKRIKAAIQLDNFSPIFENSKLTSSAVDSTQIFHQILTTWNQLSWPDVNSASALVAKIIDDMCNCIMFYAEIICKKWEIREKSTTLAGSNCVSGELCFVINDIEHLGQEMILITEKMKLENIYKELETQNGSVSKERYKSSITTIIENAYSNVGSKINHTILKIWEKIAPTVSQHFCAIVEGSFPLSKDTTKNVGGMDTLMAYLDKNYTVLQDVLSEVAFKKMLPCTWDKICRCLHCFTCKCVEEKRPCGTFQNIETLTQSLMNYFRHPENLFDVNENLLIREIQEIINLHGTATEVLILKYQTERALGKCKSGDFGVIALVIAYCTENQILNVEVLNCRNLKSTDKNGLSDPFVSLEVSPRKIFAAIPKMKTKVQKATLFPLFEEKFNMPLDDATFALNGILHITVKDYDLIGRNDFIGETFILLDSIAKINSSTDFANLPQLHLHLTGPTECPILKTLENRLNDKIAVDFAKRERRKIQGISSTV